jgi:tetratricopeptide (TPR) repeat protein
MERHGKSREALKYYLAAIEKNPNDERAWILQGNLQVRMGMDAYREALRLNPQNESLRQWLENHR